MQQYRSYQDVLLVPNYSELETRNDADVSVKFLGKKFRIPVIPSNMVSVIDQKIARQFSNNDLFYVMHRFGINPHTFVYDNPDINNISISVGVSKTNEEYKNLLSLAGSHLKVDYITIDVAHGDHLMVKDRIFLLKKYFPNSKIIAGNVATLDGYKRLVEWGADAVKVGIGQGSICTTRFKTGFSLPMFDCVREIAQSRYAKSYGVPIIADGGIKDIGDISKALVAGATMAMCGSLFAKCADSPAKIVDGKKLYFGSTSYEAKGHKSYIEGQLLHVEVDPPLMERVEEIEMGLKSAVSYSGGKDLSGFKNVKYVYTN